MDTIFVEAGHGPNGGNWGKFMLGRYTATELAEPTRFPGCEGRRVVSLRGPGHQQVWVADLATGEAVRFNEDWGRFTDELEDHQVLVCPLFEPFIRWLDQHRRDNPGAWWSTVPRTLTIPDAPTAMYGYRRTRSRLIHQ